EGVVLDDHQLHVEVFDGAKGLKGAVEGGGWHFAASEGDAHGAVYGGGELARGFARFVQELADEAHAVFVLGEAFVLTEGRDFAACHEVPLVGEEGEGGAEVALEALLDCLYLVDEGGGFFGFERAEVELDLVVAVAAVAGEADGDDADGLDV